MNLQMEERLFFTNNNYADEEDKAVNPALEEEIEPRSVGEKDKVVKAQPTEVDEFRAQVEAIKRSLWFVNNCGDVLMDVFNGMSNLRVSGS